ncbi:MAG TPA: alpha/beta hydrolase [Candidatus Saccharimonadales bacterium]|nr:alpha/beta hydrolase [Candidatus Saccharimonadales bacterium]
MNAIIFHGTDDKPGSYWQTWLKDELEKAGYQVEMPYLPQLNHEPIADSLARVLTKYHFGKETVLVGHSAGVSLILSILEKIEPRINKAIMVAGPAYISKNMPVQNNPAIQDSYDWSLIKKHAKEFVFVNSINDPWGCDDQHGRKMFDNLGGTLIIKNEGHMGSTKFNQPYKRFPLLKFLILGDGSEG